MSNHGIDEIMESLNQIWEPGFQFLDEADSLARILYRDGKEKTRQRILDSLIRDDQQMAKWLSQRNCRKMFEIIRRRMIRRSFKKPRVVK